MRLLVLHEVFGLNDHIRDVTARFTAEGFDAVAPDMFAGVRANASLPEILECLARLPIDRILEETPPGDAVVGFCIGGRLARMLAGKRKLAAVVDFYGSHVVETPSCPYLGIFGEDDAGIPLADVEKLRARLGPNSRIHVYPGAGHGFFNDTRAAYRPDAAADAWAKTIEFLKKCC